MLNVTVCVLRFYVSNKIWSSDVVSSYQVLFSLWYAHFSLKNKQTDETHNIDIIKSHKGIYYLIKMRNHESQFINVCN